MNVQICDANLEVAMPLKWYRRVCPSIVNIKEHTLWALAQVKHELGDCLLKRIKQIAAYVAYVHMHRSWHALVLVLKAA